MFVLALIVCNVFMMVLLFGFNDCFYEVVLMVCYYEFASCFGDLYGSELDDK